MRNWFRKWLGINTLVTRCDAQQIEINIQKGWIDRLNDDKNALREDLDATGDALVKTRTQLLEAVMQVNRNTAVIARWSVQSATLAALEAKHRVELKRQSLKAQLVREAEAKKP